MSIAAAIADFQRKVGAPQPQPLGAFKHPHFASPAAGMAAHLKVLSSQAKNHFKGTSDGRWLRVELMLEELAEVIKGMADGNEVETLDGLIDLVYVTVGTLNALDLPFESAFAEVHASNMSKHSGAALHTGDKGKGPDFVPADMAKVLSHHRAHR